MGDHPRLPDYPPRRDLAVRLEVLHGLTVALLQEIDSIAGSDPPGAKPSVNFYEEVSRFEADLLRWALRRTGGNQHNAARLLNLKCATFHGLIRRYGIRPDAFKTADGDFLP